MNNETAIRMQKEVQKVVMGKEAIIEKVLASMLAGGHILLEDIPGVGKTTLALAFSKVMSLKYKRTQFTPDVLPADITGFSLYNKKTDSFDYVEGAALCNIYLADEINRTSPKTQSALLEVMEEGSVTVDGVTRNVPVPFFVIATQNPIGSVGTQRLPESQMDRFMVRLSIGYPDAESEIRILKGESESLLGQVESVVDAQTFQDMQKQVEAVYVSDALYTYLISIVNDTRTNENFSLGISPRGTISFYKMAKAMAFIRGRDYLTPEDVLDVFSDIAAHRVILSNRAKAKGMTLGEALEDVKKKFPMP